MTLRPLFLTISFTMAVCSGGAWAIEAHNVLVLYNADDGVGGMGGQIASHYESARPGVHTVGISGVNSITFGSTQEYVSAQDYLDVIRPQVLNAIGSIPDSIDVIVTTKGMPLRVDAGNQPAGNTSLNWKRFSSLESELTRIDSIDTLDKMGDQFIFTGFPQFDTTLGANPYYNENAPFIRSGSDPFNGDIRLSSRLDGYTVDSVKASIDRAQNAYVVPFGQHIIADDTAFDSIDQMTQDGSSGNGPGPGLVEHLSDLYGDDATESPLLFENTNAAVTQTNRPVIGYVSHGTNDGGNPLSLGDNYLGEFVEGSYQPTQVWFELANGAIFHTHESFNAESFDWQNSQADGLVADWIELGGTAGLGHVAEPLNGRDNVANEDLLYQMLLPSSGPNAAPGESGLTFVEAAWNATRQLSYMNTVVGDPLMRWQQWLPGDINLDGTVNLFDVAILNDNWQQPATVAQGDVNNDGIVNLFDVAILNDNWQQSIAVNTSPEAVSMLTIDSATGRPRVVFIVPEPSTISGLITSMLVMIGVLRTALRSK